VQIQLIWTDPNTGERRQPQLETPIAIGRVFTEMPAEIEGKRVSRIVLADDRIANYHALIDVFDNELVITDRNSSSGTLINGVRLPSSTLVNGDRLQIGTIEIEIQSSTIRAQTPAPSGQWTCDRNIGFLIPRTCGRTERTGCPHCGGDPNNDPYFSDRSYYAGYGSYNRGYWGSTYYSNRDYYVYDPVTGNVDFTEADNASLEMEGDTDFEMDMGAS
jgi:hypothetical protein